MLKYVEKYAAYLQCLFFKIDKRGNLQKLRHFSHVCVSRLTNLEGKFSICEVTVFILAVSGKNQVFAPWPRVFKGKKMFLFNLTFFEIYFASLIPWKVWKKSHCSMHAARSITCIWIWHKMKTRLPLFCCKKWGWMHVNKLTTLFSASDSEHSANEESTQLQSWFSGSQEPWIWKAPLSCFCCCCHFDTCFSFPM